MYEKTYFVIFYVEFWSQQLWDQRRYIPFWKTVRQFFFLRIGFHKTCHIFRFQGIANISSYVFHTFCLIYPTLSNDNFLSIGFHMTCHFFRFQGIANIASYVFHIFCLVYPALSDKKFLSIGFHKTCHIFRFQGIANISNYVFHTFCLIYPAYQRTWFFFVKVNSQNFIHCTDPVIRPGLKP